MKHSPKSGHESGCPIPNTSGWPILCGFIAKGGLFARSANRLLFTLCLLTASTSLAQTPPTTTPDITITKPLAAQPDAKPVSRRQARQADDAYLAGSALLDKNQPEKAQAAFERAAKLNPAEQKYAVAVAIARENVVSSMVRKSQVMRSAGNAAGADALLAAAARIDPDNTLITEHQPQIQPHLEFQPYLPSAAGVMQPQYAQVIELAPDQTTQSFHFRADAHEVLRRVLLAYGIKAQFNADVPANSVRLDIDDATFRQMQPILGMMTGTFLNPIDPKTALVIKDTQENHDQFDHLALENIYMPGFSTDQLHDAATMLQQVLDMQHVVVSTGSGTMTIRAPMDMMRIANYELADLLDGGSELVLDMKVYTIDKTNAKDIGIAMTNSVSAFNIASAATTITNQYSTQISAAIAAGLIPSTASTVQIVEYLFGAGLLNGNALLTGLLGTVGGGLTYTGVTAASLPSLNFGFNQSEDQSLEDVQLQVGDKKTATFRVGTKYPIITASYSAGGGASSLLAGLSTSQLAALGLTSASASAATTASIPQIQYEDLGLTLKATPTVLRSGNVSLQLDLKIEALAGTSLNNIPILASRALTSNVTLLQGQSAMLATSMSRQESNAVSGIPGLSELPGFQDTTNTDKEVDTTELVITLTPRLVRRGHNNLASLPLQVPHTAAAQARNDD
jgi:Flp pilus assembly secretin CpaC